MKKTIINVVLILVTFLIYYLQSNFFSWFTIAGIMPNIFVIFVLFIGLFTNKMMGTIYGIAIGVFLDLTLGNIIGTYAISLGLIGFVATIIDKNFSKDSRMTIMFMVLGSTVAFELISCIINNVFLEINFEIINFIKILVIEIIYNMIITIIIYPLIQKAGYYLENEYKGNKILTRYF